MYRVVVIAGDLESPNRGVSALTEGAVRALARHYGPGLELTIINSAGPREYSGARVNGNLPQLRTKIKPNLRELSKSVLKGYLSRFLPLSLGERLIRADRILAEIAAADVIVDLAEGDSFTSIYGRQRLVRHTLYKLPALALSKPLVLFPQTIGPFTSIGHRSLAAFVLSRASVVFTREAVSTDVVKSLVRGRTKVIEGSDMAFILEPTEVNCSGVDELDSYIGLNVSALLMQGQRSRHQRLQWDPRDYRTLMSSLLIRFVREFDRNVLLVPHVINPGEPTDDRRANQQLYEDLPKDVRARVWPLLDTLSASQLKYVIGRSDFFVGARMHSCIAAISSYVPTVPIAYSHKFRGVFQQLGLESHVVDPQNMSMQDVSTHVFECYRNRDEIREHLKLAVPKAESGAWSVLDWLNFD